MRFNSLHDLVAYVDKLPMLPGFHKQDEETTVRWAGGSHELATKLATYGWGEGARLASDLSTRIANRIVEATGASVYPAIEYDVIGAAYDAGAVALGMPESWGVMAPTVAKNAVRIVLNCTVSAGVPESSIRARGLAVGALVLALQSRGYPVTVDVWQGEGCSHNKGIAGDMVRVTDASTGSQLDLDRMVYALAHPTFFRKLLRAVTNGIRCDGHNVRTGKWDGGTVEQESRPEDGEAIHLFLGGAHLDSVARWRDGGEAWVLGEYLKQAVA